jgi:histidyl-tRNA synthetase
MLLLDEAGIEPPDAQPDAYAVLPNPDSLAAAMSAVEALRAAGVSVHMHAGGGSMKSQFKRADASGARWALIFGDDEMARGEVSLKPLRDPQAPQTTRSLTDAAAWAAELRK